ncbi:MAG TPA: type II toxin-antitoxin system VapC family toxin [Atribacteraceae bacterium]|nr:type II toxin-antitoxin system VapC family toxin [Atribacteraceae bacterium]
MKRIALDTNAYVAYKRGEKEALEIIRSAQELGISVVVLGEMLSGFSLGRNEERNRLELAQFLDSPRMTVLSVDEETPEYYARIFLSQRKKGKPVPTNDLWIAATALQNGFALFSHDAHFQQIEGLISGCRKSDFLP